MRSTQALPGAAPSHGEKAWEGGGSRGECRMRYEQSVTGAERRTSLAWWGAGREAGWAKKHLSRDIRHHPSEKEGVAFQE